MSSKQTPAQKSVVDWVQSSKGKGVEVSPPNPAFSFDGVRGTGQSKLCRHYSDGRTECLDIAMEAKDLFSTMGSLNFFCALPQDPTRTHIQCQRIPDN